ncbi:hypothetical protein KIW84_077059 [Lathyrus oleraceus]|uniref:Uncharacterized protein n=1 Tax=Pisum sativum TaxID=3888 RepID=A0A9D4W0U4_PEA|nr:hypothetical protein KIW84_077059 [Pisum sativum]
MAFRKRAQGSMGLMIPQQSFKLVASLRVEIDLKFRFTTPKRPRLLDFVSSIEDAVVKRASEKAFESLPDVEKAISELSALKGVGPATASAVLAAFAPNLTPFMSDECI